MEIWKPVDEVHSVGIACGVTVAEHEIWPVSKALWRKPHVTSNVLSANAAWAQFDNHGCALQSLLEVEPPGKAAPAQRCWVCQDKWPGPSPPPWPSSTHRGQPAPRWGSTLVLVFLLQHQIWSNRRIDRKTTMIGQTEPSWWNINPVKRGLIASLFLLKNNHSGDSSESDPGVKHSRQSWEPWLLSVQGRSPPDFTCLYTWFLPGTEGQQDFPRWTSSRTRLSGLSPGLTTWSTGAGLAIFETHNTFWFLDFVLSLIFFPPPEKALCGLWLLDWPVALWRWCTLPPQDTTWTGLKADITLFYCQLLCRCVGWWIFHPQIWNCVPCLSPTGRCHYCGGNSYKQGIENEWNPCNQSLDSPLKACAWCLQSPIHQMAPAFRKVYDQMPEPRWVVSNKL